MQIHEPSFRDCSSLRRISACNACSRPMSWYLAYPRTGNQSRRVSSWPGIRHSLKSSAPSFYSSGCCRWLFRDSASWKGRQNCILRVTSEKGKQKESKELESGETVLEVGGRKQGKKNDIVCSTDNSGGRPSASKATAAAKNQDNVRRRDNEAVRIGNANIQQIAGNSVEGRQKGSSSKATTKNSSLPSVPSSAKTDATKPGTPRVLVSGSLPTQTRAVLQPEESVGSPLWQTFASNASGVWGGVGAAFSPRTAEMEALSVGEKNERLYDAHILCTVETAEVTDEEKATKGLKRKILCRVDNPHGEQALGQRTVQDIDRDGDEFAEEAVNFRGEAGEATLLGEIDSSLELVGADEIESVEQDMLSVSWQDGESYLQLTELEDSTAPAVPAVTWDSELSAGGELGIGWEQGEGALGNAEVSEQVTLEQINEEWKSIVEQNNEKMDKQWEDIEKIEDGPEIFGTEGGLSPNSMTAPDVQPSMAETMDDVRDIVSSPFASMHRAAGVISSGTYDAWDDVMKEDFMGQEDGLVFFEDGSYSRGPLRTVPQASNNDNHAFKVEQCLAWGGHKRLRVLHTIYGDGEKLQVLRVVAYEEEWLGPASTKFMSKTGSHSLVPLSQRSRLSPEQLTGKWKLFAVTASVIYPSSGRPVVAYSCMETSVTRTFPDTPQRGECEDEGVGREVLYLPGGISASLEINHNGTFTVGAGWLLEDKTRVSVERDYDMEGRLVQVCSYSEIKGDWVGGRM